MSLPGLPWTIAEAARRFADRTAYVTPGGWPLSYTDIDRLSDEVAVGLAERGVRAGDVVGVVLPAGPEYLLTYAAAAKLGAITAGSTTASPPASGTKSSRSRDPVWS